MQNNQAFVKTVRSERFAREMAQSAIPVKRANAAPQGIMPAYKGKRWTRDDKTRRFETLQ